MVRASIDARGAAPQSTEDLTSAERQLLEWCQRLQFGTIRNLRIAGGQPWFEPPPILDRIVKVGSRSNDRPPPSGGFALKDKQSDLIRRLREIRSGVLLELEVRHGLPELFKVREPAAW